MSTILALTGHTTSRERRQRRVQRQLLQHLDSDGRKSRGSLELYAADGFSPLFTFVDLNGSDSGFKFRNGVGLSARSRRCHSTGRPPNRLTNSTRKNDRLCLIPPLPAWKRIFKHVVTMRSLPIMRQGTPCTVSGLARRRRGIKFTTAAGLLAQLY